MIPSCCQLRRSCPVGPVEQLGLGLPQENMGLRGRCMNRQTIQSALGLQHLMLQTAYCCSVTLTHLTGADFLQQEHIVLILTVGMRLHTKFVDKCIQMESVTVVSEILHENVLSCVELVLRILNHCGVIMHSATMT